MPLLLFFAAIFSMFQLQICALYKLQLSPKACIHVVECTHAIITHNSKTWGDRSKIPTQSHTTGKMKDIHTHTCQRMPTRLHICTSNPLATHTHIYSFNTHKYINTRLYTNMLTHANKSAHVQNFTQATNMHTYRIHGLLLYDALT